MCVWHVYGNLLKHISSYAQKINNYQKLHSSGIWRAELAAGWAVVCCGRLVVCWLAGLPGRQLAGWAAWPAVCWLGEKNEAKPKLPNWLT